MIEIIILPILIKAKCAHAPKGLALPRASHSSKIALAASRRLRSTLAAMPVLFAHTIVIEIKIGRIITPSDHSHLLKRSIQKGKKQHAYLAVRIQAPAPNAASDHNCA